MPRHAAYIASLAPTVASPLPATRYTGWCGGVAVFGPLALLGTSDVRQRRSTLRRNDPILADLRYGLESIGPEMRQYFIQPDTTEVPFSCEQRALVYRRSRGLKQDHAVLRDFWKSARSDAFLPPDHMLRRRASKVR